MYNGAATAKFHRAAVSNVRLDDKCIDFRRRELQGPGLVVNAEHHMMRIQRGVP
jgi:hypothetical protein